MREPSEAPARAFTYCIVPRELAAKLHEPLRKHFRDDRSVEVVVEQRGAERRRQDDRRVAGRAVAEERRRIRNAGGRRVADRRAAAVAVRAPADLPRRVRAHVARLAFVERIEPPTQVIEDRDTSRIVTRFQAGDAEAFSALYMRYFDRVYSYLRVVLKDPHEAEDITQHAFAEVFEALPRYERRGQPFRAWLFTIVRNCAVSQLRRDRRTEVVEPAEVDRRRDRGNDEPGELPVLDWISDADVLLFIERLPLAQRQVLTLRYMIGLSTEEIAAVLDRSPEAVRMQLSRALGFLRRRLAAIGRRTVQPGERHRSRPLVPQARVLRVRRFGLLSTGPTG